MESVYYFLNETCFKYIAEYSFTELILKFLLKLLVKKHIKVINQVNRTIKIIQLTNIEYEHSDLNYFRYQERMQTI